MNLPVRLFHEVQINMSAIFNLSLLVQPLWVVFSALTRVTLASISGFLNQYIYGKGGWWGGGGGWPHAQRMTLRMVPRRPPHVALTWAPSGKRK